MEHTVNRSLRPLPNATFVPLEPRRRFTFITQSPHARPLVSPQPASAPVAARTSHQTSASANTDLQESPLVAACRRYAQQHGGLGRRADGDNAADATAQGDSADDQESPLVRAARKRALEAQKHQQAQQR
jgi:hypothetical protein